MAVYHNNKIIRGIQIWFDKGNHSRVNDPLTYGKAIGTRPKLHLNGHSLEKCTLYKSSFKGGRLGGIDLRLENGQSLRAGALSGEAYEVRVSGRDKKNNAISGTVLTGLYGRQGADIDALGLMVGDQIVNLNIEKVEYNKTPTQQHNLGIDSIDSVTLINTGQNTPQSSSITRSRTLTASNSWSQSAGAKIGVSTSIKTGIPFVADGEVGVSVEASYNFTWGEGLETSDTFEYTATANVPAQSEIEAEVLVTRTEFDLTYSAIATAEYKSGFAQKGRTNGIYEGIHSQNVQIRYRTPHLANARPQLSIAA